MRAHSDGGPMFTAALKTASEFKSIQSFRVHDVFRKNKCYYPDDQVIIQPNENPKFYHPSK
jgi:hypothetical protein